LLILSFGGKDGSKPFPRAEKEEIVIGVCETEKKKGKDQPRKESPVGIPNYRGNPGIAIHLG